MTSEDKYKEGYFNPYTFDYKSYIKEMYNLNEMPNRLKHINFPNDDTILNHMEGVRIEDSCRFLENFKVGSNTYRLYFEKYDQNECYYLLIKDEPFLVMEYAYHPIQHPINGIENKVIWNHIWHKGMFRYFFDCYIIPIKPIIITDYVMTDRGYIFWQYLLKEYVNNKKTHKLYVIDLKTGGYIINVNDVKIMNDYFSDKDVGNYRFVMEKL